MPGRPLGVEPECRYDEVPLALPPGSTLVLYTDGATEARDDRGRQFGEEGLRDVLRSAPAGAEATVATVTAAVEAQLQGSRHEADDLAVLALTMPR